MNEIYRLESQRYSINMELQTLYAELDKLLKDSEQASYEEDARENRALIKEEERLKEQEKISEQMKTEKIENQEPKRLTPDELFRKKQSEMPDNELADKVDEALSSLCRTGGQTFRMCVPPSINDTDMLISELVRRFRESTHPASPAPPPDCAKHHSS